ncbi:MAG: SDR family oxidoreductase [Rectinema sp.]
MKTMFRLDGKVAFVTGAATGLGQSIAATLARQGALLAIADKPGVSLDRTMALIEASGSKAFGVAMDIRDTVQIEAGTQAVQEKYGRIDILVNNAGINRPAPGLDVDPANWDDHYATNVRGGFFVAQHCVRSMIANGWGRIVFISSQSGLVGIPGQPVYCSTKGAIIQLVRTLGVEWAKYGITVNSVAPTFVETDLTRKRLQNPEFLKFVLGKIPAGKLAMPEDVAAAVAFLASAEAGMVNCATLTVDGGWTAW